MIKRRVLFVDDEPNIIDGLRRMLRKQRDVWDMEFASSGAEALAKMAVLSVDVLVTDIQMPGMSGADLLERVVQAYPKTARIALSGHVDENIATRVIGLAHRFVSKPADAEALINAIDQSCSLQSEVVDDRLGQWIASCRSLPSLPSLYVELTQAANSETSDARSIAAIISRDMAISAKILQLVNSSFFGIARRISSIEQTVAMLGLVRIRSLVLAEHVFRAFEPGVTAAGISIPGLWRHSCLVAEAARRISRAEKQQNDRCDQAFTAGLLHDIGVLVLATQAPDLLLSVINAEDRHETSRTVREQRILGLTHGEIGAHLLKLWGLPPRVTEAVRLHHMPLQCTYDGVCAVTCVHAADAILSELTPMNYTANSDINASHLELSYLARIGLTGRLPAWRDVIAHVIESEQGQEMAVS